MSELKLNRAQRRRSDARARKVLTGYQHRLLAAAPELATVRGVAYRYAVSYQKRARRLFQHVVPLPKRTQVGERPTSPEAFAFRGVKREMRFRYYVVDVPTRTVVLPRHARHKLSLKMAPKIVRRIRDESE
jgi:hypothetical protein